MTTGESRLVATYSVNIAQRADSQLNIVTKAELLHNVCKFVAKLMSRNRVHACRPQQRRSIKK